jgi:hypothetical protein
MLNIINIEQVKLMKFAEIAILLREIVDRCPSLDGATITLIPQKAMYPLYNGYHINIKANLSKESMGNLRKIVEGHDLVMQIKTDSVIVYETRSS